MKKKKKKKQLRRSRKKQGLCRITSCTGRELELVNRDPRIHLTPVGARASETPSKVCEKQHFGSARFGAGRSGGQFEQNKKIIRTRRVCWCSDADVKIGEQGLPWWRSG